MKEKDSSFGNVGSSDNSLSQEMYQEPEKQIIEQQIEKTEKILNRTLHTLREQDKDSVAEVLGGLYPLALPYLIKSRKGNPIHHSLQVVEFIVEIALGEKVSDTELKNTVISALLHDTGAEGKIRKADIIEETDPNKREELRQKAISLRKEHMLAGAKIAQEVIENFDVQYPRLVLKEDVEIIKKIIKVHDNPSIQEYEEANNGKWLLSKDDKLTMFHREADRLWMLSEEGIEADLQRDEKNTGERDPMKRIKGNIQRHQEEYQLYEEAYGEERVKEYGFREKTLYRTGTGFIIFKRLIREAEERYNIKANTSFNSSR